MSSGKRLKDAKGSSGYDLHNQLTFDLRESSKRFPHSTKLRLIKEQKGGYRGNSA
jgi:hypothetical protein